MVVNGTYDRNTQTVHIGVSCGPRGFYRRHGTEGFVQRARVELDRHHESFRASPGGTLTKSRSTGR
jgi:hypothetical protein